MLGRTVTAYKAALFDHPGLRIITPSRWLRRCATKSLVLGKREITVIPYALDAQIYQREDKSNSRKILGLPLDSLLVLFSGSSGRERRKGLEHALAAMETLASNLPRHKCYLVCMGTCHKLPEQTRFPILNLGTIRNEKTMVQILSACDVLLHPSLEDNLPNGIMEASSCGLPVIAYDSGGVEDLILEGINGTLVPRADTQRLGETLEQFVSGNLTFPAFNRSEWLPEKYLPVFHANACLALYKAALASQDTQVPPTPQFRNPIEIFSQDALLQVTVQKVLDLNKRNLKLRQKIEKLTKKMETLQERIEHKPSSS